MPANADTEAHIECPRCGAVSYHPDDIAQGYCGQCHWWTSDPRGQLNRPVRYQVGAMSPEVDSERYDRPSDGLGHYAGCESACPCYRAGFHEGYGKGRDDEADDVPIYQPPPTEQFEGSGA